MVGPAAVLVTLTTSALIITSELTSWPLGSGSGYGPLVVAILVAGLVIAGIMASTAWRSTQRALDWLYHARRRVEDAIPVPSTEPRPITEDESPVHYGWIPALTIRRCASRVIENSRGRIKNGHRPTKEDNNVSRVQSQALAEAVSGILLKAGNDDWRQAHDLFEDEQVRGLLAGIQIAVKDWDRNVSARRSSLEDALRLLGKEYPAVFRELEDGIKKAHQEQEQRDRQDESIRAHSADIVRWPASGNLRLDAYGILDRFGIDPAWGFARLCEIGDPLARRMELQTRQLAAHAIGALVGCIVSLVMLFGFAIPLAVALSGDSAGQNSQAGPGDQSADLIAKVVLLGFAAASSFFLFYLGARTNRDLAQNIDGFYDDVAGVFELRRFELYRALNLRIPLTVGEEQSMTIAHWRRSSLPELAYDLVGQGGDGAATSTPTRTENAAAAGQGLTRYDGYLSWLVTDSAIEVTISGTKADRGESVRLQVEGSERPAAPFVIEANSVDVALPQVRAAVDAPTDGSPRKVIFDFRQGIEEPTPEPTVWLEVRQRGRFIRLLRVDVNRTVLTQTEP